MAPPAKYCHCCAQPLPGARRYVTGITRRQRLLKEAHDQFVEKMGYEPTFKQLAFMLDVKSTSTVCDMARVMALHGVQLRNPVAGGGDASGN